MRILYTAIIGSVVLMCLVGCKPVSTSVYDASVSQAADITKTEGGEVIGSVGAGEPVLVVCKTEKSYAMVLPDGMTGEEITTGDGVRVGFVPLDAMDPGGSEVPSCTVGNDNKVHIG